jgi:hypothetical protein
VSFFIDWLRTLFDPKLYPWFGDEFIHPRDLARHIASQTGPTLGIPSVMRPTTTELGS